MVNMLSNKTKKSALDRQPRFVVVFLSSDDVAEDTFVVHLWLCVLIKWENSKRCVRKVLLCECYWRKSTRNLERTPKRESIKNSRSSLDLDVISDSEKRCNFLKSKTYLPSLNKSIVYIFECNYFLKSSNCVHMLRHGTRVKNL